MAERPDSVTVTPGKTPPWSSVTLPTSSPKVWPVCAAAGLRPHANKIASTATPRMIRLTGFLLLNPERPTIGPNDTRGVTLFSNKLDALLTRRVADTRIWILAAGQCALPFARVSRRCVVRRIVTATGMAVMLAIGAVDGQDRSAPVADLLKDPAVQ